MVPGFQPTKHHRQTNKMPMSDIYVFDIIGDGDGDDGDDGTASMTMWHEGFIDED